MATLMPHATTDALRDAFSWDVAIVGAGPAGSITALVLARAGHRVLLVDHWQFPRDNAYGDALIPDALAALSRHGLRERIEAKGARWNAGTAFGPLRASVTVDAPFVTIRRTVLDAELLAAAIEAGAACRGSPICCSCARDGDRGCAPRSPEWSTRRYRRRTCSRRVDCSGRSAPERRVRAVQPVRVG